jgi:hypothetical protein
MNFAIGKKGNLAAALVCACLAWGCGDQAGSGNRGGESAEVVLGSQGAIEAKPEAILPNEPLIDGLSSGRLAELVLDKCPDPVPPGLGSLVCGATYQIYWEAPTKRWVAFGPNGAMPKGDGFDATLGKYPGTPPKQRIAIVWGLWLTLNQDDSVQMEKGPIIGSLRHVTPMQSLEVETGKVETGAAEVPAANAVQGK